MNQDESRAPLIFDLETGPDQREGALTRIRENVTAPATYKKPESIAAWIAENADRVADEQWRKTALDAAQGEIFVFGYAWGDEKPQTISRAPGFPERDFLEHIFDMVSERIEANDRRNPQFIGHNVRSFDLAFLWRRAVVNNIRPPFRIPWDVRPGDDRVYDTLERWTGGYGAPRISLDNLCHALGVESSKGDMDGSMVPQAIMDGRMDEVTEYCRQDVVATRECWRRMTFQ